jgi:pimeloyl-ACP methyl ester carboxylesterase
MLKQEALAKLRMPVLTLFGENEFAFNTQKATDTAKAVIADLEIEIVKNTSHLLSVSTPEYVNERILSFLK